MTINYNTKFTSVNYRSIEDKTGKERLANFNSPNDPIKFMFSADGNLVGVATSEVFIPIHCVVELFGVVKEK